jgi:formiminotetrahydrofolate cyclodeaminase
MVCNLTLAKTKDNVKAKRLQQILTQAETKRAELVQLAAADQNAVEVLMAAISLPRTTPAQQTARQQAIQAGYVGATTTSVAIATTCAEVLQSAHQVAEVGSSTAWGDTQAAIYCATAGVSISSLNGYLNLGAINDNVFAETQKSTLDTLLATCNLVDAVQSRLEQHQENKSSKKSTPR